MTTDTSHPVVKNVNVPVPLEIHAELSERARVEERSIAQQARLYINQGLERDELVRPLRPSTEGKT
jgi:hypothetical protein